MWPSRQSSSQLDLLIQSMLQKLLHLRSQVLIKTEVSADWIVDVTGWVQCSRFFRCRRNERHHGGGVRAAHGEDHVGLVNQLHREGSRAVFGKVGAEGFDGFRAL